MKRSEDNKRRLEQINESLKPRFHPSIDPKSQNLSKDRKKNAYLDPKPNKVLQSKKIAPVSAVNQKSTQMLLKKLQSQFDAHAHTPTMTQDQAT